MWWEMDAGPALLLHFGMVRACTEGWGARSAFTMSTLTRGGGLGCITSLVHTPCGAACQQPRCNPLTLTRPAPYPRALVMQTGGLVVKGIGAAHYKSFTIDDSAWPPRFCKIELKLEDGTQVGDGV